MNHSLKKIKLKDEKENKNKNFNQINISLKENNNNNTSDNKTNTSNTKEITDAEKNEEEKKLLKNKNKFDEIPIKPSEYNFMELVEKTLAKEENNYPKGILRENSNPNLIKNRIYIEKNRIKRNHPGKSNKNIRDENKKVIEKINSSFPSQEMSINAFNINNNTKKINDDEINSIKIDNDNIHINNICEKNYKKITEVINEDENYNTKFQSNENNEQINNDIKNTNIKNSQKNINCKEQINNFYSFQNDSKNNNEISIMDKEIISELPNNNDNDNTTWVNRDHLIQQKIKELNSEIIKFKEERNKVCKLKLEYEKLQTKLINDVKQFTLKKEEFEKYRQEELNKIKNEKKKILTENKLINNIKIQNQSYAMTIKKDKETIKNLKDQIAEYQFIFKQKENENKRHSIKNNKKPIEFRKLNELELNYFETNNPLNDNKICYGKKIKVSERNINRNNERAMRNYSSISGKMKRKYDDISIQNIKLENSCNGLNISKKEIIHKTSKSDINYVMMNKENLENSVDSLKKNVNEDKSNNNPFCKNNNLQNQFQYLSENYNITNNKGNAIDIKINNQNLNKKSSEDIKSNNNKRNFLKNNQNSTNNVSKINQKRITYKTKTETKFCNKGKNNGKLNTNINEQFNPNKSTNINKKNNKPVKNITISSLSSKNISIKRNSNKNTQNTTKNESYDFIIPKKYTEGNYKLLKSLTSDGKIINLYTNNKREIIFESGIRKEIFDDGYHIVYFINGDLKQTFPDGKTVYFFNEAKTTQTSYNDGLQVFKFNNGQIEKHYPNGTKQITFPNGTVRYISNDGYEETYYVDGSVQKINNGIVENENNNVENIENNDNTNNVDNDNNNDDEENLFSERGNLQNNIKSVEKNNNMENNE